LPSEPKIFHGRDAEISEVLRAFTHETPRIAVLGAGGMGKTSLVRIILHHTEIAARYGQHRFFVSCDTASTKEDLANIIGAHLGIDPGRDLTKPVIRSLLECPPCLLILDNLEAVWEPAEFRKSIEDFLCLLADVQHLALIITMRGAERPANVRWTRPFLQPLQPLSQDAAQKVFLAITDDSERLCIENLDEILHLTGNIPLVIDLISHLVESDGSAAVLLRWKKEATSTVSEGHDHRSNLDLSISLSLSSPRMRTLPQAQGLLSLLSMLPDGLSDLELRQSELPIQDILTCKAVLLRTSLAYTDENQRLKVLVPIRQYMQKQHPAFPALVQPLLTHFTELLHMHRRYLGTSSHPGIISRITSNLANIENILQNGL
ncbi:P-loop containing nucleoside triphosphate hydrolase protein, partial [Mycena alexandri]